MSFTIKVPKQKGGKAKKKDQPKKEEDSEDEWGDLAKVCLGLHLNISERKQKRILSSRLLPESKPMPTPRTLVPLQT